LFIHLDSDRYTYTDNGFTRTRLHDIRFDGELRGRF